ncbi:MAG TPA: hypothetical protein VGY13_04230 [Solirubrobacteraceae bacterium]|nr:hypothetical protein [Solirubrobacteraceae bacterium]
MREPQPRQLALARWAGGLGAVTAHALAEREGIGLRCAHARLAAAERAGLMRGELVLAGAPRLYTATSAGLRACGLRGIEPGRVSAAGARHAIVCAFVAAWLEHAYPGHRVLGERELRRDERDAGRALASARVGGAGGDAAPLHRPDLVLAPANGEGLPVAVEVELTVKAPQRLLEICRGWARCGCVAGTVYLAGADVLRPLERAIARAHAGERVALVALATLDERFVPGAA